MHKKLESDLISLAHSILQMKNKDNVFLLKQKSKEIYEKLSVLAFVEEYVNSGPNLKQTKEEVISKIETAFQLESSEKEFVETVTPQIEKVQEIKNEIVEELKIEVKVEEIIEQPFDELVELMHSDEVITEEVNAETKVEEIELELTRAEEEVKEEVVEEIKVETKIEETIEQPFVEPVMELIRSNKEINIETEVEEIVEEPVTDITAVKVQENKALTLEEELEDTISVDQLATLFDLPVPRSLNDRLGTNIQIGLNDRIIFVKNLFEGSQEDFNRVVSQLNTYATEKEAKRFIQKMVKPDYDWSQQEELEARFVEIVERKFA